MPHQRDFSDGEDEYDADRYPMKTAVTTMSQTTASDISQQPTRTIDVQRPTGHTRDPTTAHLGVAMPGEIPTATTDTLVVMDAADVGRMAHALRADASTTRLITVSSVARCASKCMAQASVKSFKNSQTS